MTQLVQIAINAHRSSYHWQASQALVVKASFGQRPKEVVELVEALSRMFERIGMRQVCISCWKQERLPDVQVVFRRKFRNYAVHGESGGCCDACPLLGHGSCLNKPILCAEWMCGYTSIIWPATRDFMDWLRYQRVCTGPWIEGLLRELRTEFSEVDLKVLRILRHAVDAWYERPKAHEGNNWTVRTAS